MHKKLLILVLTVVVLFQFWWLLAPRFGSEPYRRKERLSALAQWTSEPTAANEAACKEELRLEDAHQRNRLLIALGAFVLLDGVIVWLIRHESRQQIVA